jgi:hypothetical protein
LAQKSRNHVTGIKNDSATLTLDFATTRFFPLPVIITG